MKYAFFILMLLGGVVTAFGQYQIVQVAPGSDKQTETAIADTPFTQRMGGRGTDTIAFRPKGGAWYTGLTDTVIYPTMYDDSGVIKQLPLLWWIPKERQLASFFPHSNGTPNFGLADFSIDPVQNDALVAMYDTATLGVWGELAMGKSDGGTLLATSLGNINILNYGTGGIVFSAGGNSLTLSPSNNLFTVYPSVGAGNDANTLDIGNGIFQLQGTTLTVSSYQDVDGGLGNGAVYGWGLYYSGRNQEPVSEKIDGEIAEGDSVENCAEFKSPDGTQLTLLLESNVVASNLSLSSPLSTLYGGTGNTTDSVRVAHMADSCKSGINAVVSDSTIKTSQLSGTVSTSNGGLGSNASFNSNGQLTELDGASVIGNGVAGFKDTVNRANQSGNLINNSLSHTGTAGMYRVSVTLWTCTASGTGTVQDTIRYANDGATQVITSSTISLGTAGQSQSTVTCFNTTASTIYWSTVTGGTVGSGRYGIKIVAEYMGF